jgi:hypothetical protein
MNSVPDYLSSGTEKEKEYEEQYALFLDGTCK